MISKVDQYIVYQDGEPKTVWGHRGQAYSSALRLVMENRKVAKVMKHYARGGVFLIHTVLPPKQTETASTSKE